MLNAMGSPTMLDKIIVLSPDRYGILFSQCNCGSDSFSAFGLQEAVSYNPYNNNEAMVRGRRPRLPAAQPWPCRPAAAPAPCRPARACAPISLCPHCPASQPATAAWRPSPPTFPSPPAPPPPRPHIHHAPSRPTHRPGGADGVKRGDCGLWPVVVVVRWRNTWRLQRIPLPTRGPHYCLLTTDCH